MRQYPLDPSPDDRSPTETRGRSGRQQGSTGYESARATAEAVLWLHDLRRKHGDLLSSVMAVALILIGISLTGLSAVMDTYLHRGVETGVQRPYVVQPSGRELATNVDFRMFDPAEHPNVASTLSDAGFGFARQQISWRDIERSPGSYDWSSYDSIIKSLGGEGIGVIAVIEQTPDWALPGGKATTVDAPPQDPAALKTFTTELTKRYGRQVPFIQIWQAPNLASQWGGVPATGDTFRPYLEAAFYGGRDGNPAVHVLTPELSPLSDTRGGPTDLEFIQQLYEAKAEGLFDIVAVRLDGGTRSPDDRSVGPTRMNLSRAILFRELMVENNDATTPVWATSFGWAKSGEVNGVKQAEYVIRGLERAWSEWPWMGLMVQWEFATQPGDPNEAYAIAPAGSSTPLFERLRGDAVVRRATLANTGFAPMDADAITYNGNWADQHLEGRTFRTTSQVGSSSTITFQGTGIVAFIRSGPQSGKFTVKVDGKTIPGGAEDNANWWSLFVSYSTDDLPRALVSGLDDGEHTLTVTLEAPGELTLGGYVVEREAPFIWPVILLTSTAIVLLFLGLRSFIYLVAVRTGHLRRWKDLTSPALPRMPDWRPGR